MVVGELIRLVMVVGVLVEVRMLLLLVGVLVRLVAGVGVPVQARILLMVVEVLVRLVVLKAVGTGQDRRRKFQLRDDHIGETEECNMNTHQLLDILYDCNLNWFAFVHELEKAFPNVGEHVLEQLLLDFAGQLPFLNLSLNDERIIEQTRQVYLLKRRLQEMERNIDNGIIASESDSDSPEEFIKVRNPLDKLESRLSGRKELLFAGKQRGSSGNA